MSKKSVLSAASSGNFPISAPAIEEAMKRGNVEKVQITEYHGVELPIWALVVCSRERAPQFPTRLTEKPKGEKHHELITRSHTRYGGKDDRLPVTTTLLTLKLPPGCELLVEIKGRPPLLFSTLPTNPSQ